MLGFSEKPLVVRGMEAQLSTVSHCTEAAQWQNGEISGDTSVGF